MNALSLFLFPGTTSQVCRPHFHTPLHPWLAESKPVVPHAAHSGWISPFSKSLSHPSPSAPITIQPSSSLPSVTSSSSHSLFSFPPTPPKDSTPDMGSAGGSQNTSVHESQYPSSLEYKPLKSEVAGNICVSSDASASSMSSMSFGMTSAATAHHPMATYPSYMTGPDYTSSPLFHPASVFKAASLARVRTKSRSSSGNIKQHF